MRLNVKLYGMLGRSFDEYDHGSGLAIHLPDGASINDLLSQLELSHEGLGMIYMDGIRLNKKSLLKDGTQIKIFQPIAGG